MSDMEKQPILPAYTSETQEDAENMTLTFSFNQKFVFGVLNWVSLLPSLYLVLFNRYWSDDHWLFLLLVFANACLLSVSNSKSSSVRAIGSFMAYSLFLVACFVCPLYNDVELVAFIISVVCGMPSSLLNLLVAFKSTE